MANNNINNNNNNNNNSVITSIPAQSSNTTTITTTTTSSNNSNNNSTGICRAARSRHPAGIIRFKCAINNTIVDVLRAQGWQEIRDEGEWDIYWADVAWVREHMDYVYLEEHVKVCHYRNHYELTRKNLLARNVKRQRKVVEKKSKDEGLKFDFLPTTYELPSEYHIFVEEFKKNPGSIWIMKPVGKSQGKGIFLFRKLKDITDWKKSDVYTAYSHKDDDLKDSVQPETYIVQKYIQNPQLIQGKKYDLRIYVLVTNFAQMKVWLYRSGFARFSNSRFSLDSIQDTFVHLTNVAIQKTAPDYDPDKGCKWSLQQLRTYFIAKYGLSVTEKLFRDMDDVIIKSLQSVQKIMIHDKHCFEIYGYDILLDENLKPWLLEVNASPSMAASSRLDYELKFALLDDILAILDMNYKLTGKEIHVGGFDLIWNDGPVHSPELRIFTSNLPSYPTNSFLGCLHEIKCKKMEKALKIYARIVENIK